MTAVLEGRALAAGYGGMPAVRDLDLRVEAGEIAVLLGPNGAGKTTTVLALAGVLAPLDGEVRWDGAPTRARLHRRARAGLSLVTEERSVIRALTVRDNLRLACSVADAVALFPELEPLLGRPAGLLSGGEQQMLTLARALARKPKVLLVDEVALGLAPLVVDRLFAALRGAADAGVGVLLVEQHVRKALALADRAYVLRRGRIELAGTAAELRSRVGDIERTYLATTT
jgi:branched-chain amino acid transport system ATP-binding protein